MATAQINARIDSETKRNGDRALNEIGCSPTRAIRALWSYASENLGNSDTLRSMIETLESASNPNAVNNQEERILLAESGPLIFEQALAELGATPQKSDVPYNDLLARAYEDKMTERGTYR